MNLVIDIGNSAIKAALFDQHQLQHQYANITPTQLTQLVRADTTTAIILSSVAAIPDFLLEAARDTQHVVRLDAHTPLPFHNDYATPQTLGTDRIAAVAGAHFLYPRRNVLVIDTGSCITYELLDEQAHYRGGSISPGLHMRLRAMHTFTARLPLVELDVAQTVSLVGSQTSEALRSGAVHGTAAEITQMIRMYADKFADLQVVMCGGDATYLSRFMTQHAPIIPELVLIGLNTILQFNVNQSH